MAFSLDHRLLLLPEQSGLRPLVGVSQALCDLPLLVPGEDKECFYTTPPKNSFQVFVRTAVVCPAK